MKIAESHPTSKSSKKAINRTALKESTNNMALTGTVEAEVKGKTYRVQISPPGPMIQLEDLEKSLIANREQLREANEAIKATFRKEIFDQPAPWLLDYDSPTQKAIIAHLNIGVLIPIINMKGGDAQFNKLETWPVEQHVALMHKKAEMNILENFNREQKPFQMAVIATLLIVVLIIAVLL